MKARATILALAVSVALLACASPEATRTRAGGAGGDPGNRTPVLQMHEGSDPYWQTPRLIGALGDRDLEPSRQAQRLSTGKPTARR